MSGQGLSRVMPNDSEKKSIRRTILKVFYLLYLCKLALNIISKGLMLKIKTEVSNIMHRMNGKCSDVVSLVVGR